MLFPKYLNHLSQHLKKQYLTPALPTKKYYKPKPFTLYPAQKEWVQWAFNGGEKLLLGARGYGKTESIVLYGLFYKILQNPQTTARIYSRNYEDAKDLLRALGYLFKKHGLKGQFSSTQIILAQNQSKEPTVSLKSILGKGHKGKHVDWVIFDDPVDIMDELSPLLLKRVKTIYQNLSSIAKQGVITIGQYVCINDLYSDLQKSIDTRGYWYGSIPERDTDLKKLRQSGKSEPFITANYLGYILPSSDRPFAKIRIGDFGDQYDYACLDPSLVGKDFTALALIRLKENHIYARLYTFPTSYIDCFDNIVDILKKTQVKYFHYEDNIVGDAAYFTFKTIQGIKVYPFRSTQNKISKILKLEPYIKDNTMTLQKIYFDKQSSPEALYQVQNYNPKKPSHDDAPDALAMLLIQEGLL